MGQWAVGRGRPRRSRDLRDLCGLRGPSRSGCEPYPVSVYSTLVRPPDYFYRHLTEHYHAALPPRQRALWARHVGRGGLGEASARPMVARARADVAAVSG